MKGLNISSDYQFSFYYFLSFLDDGQTRFPCKAIKCSLFFRFCILFFLCFSHVPGCLKPLNPISDLTLVNSWVQLVITSKIRKCAHKEILFFVVAWRNNGLCAKTMENDIFVDLELCFTILEFFYIESIKCTVKFLKNLLDLRCRWQCKNKFDVRNCNFDGYFMFRSKQAYSYIYLMLYIWWNIVLGPQFIQD